MHARFLTVSAALAAVAASVLAAAGPAWANDPPAGRLTAVGGGGVVVVDRPGPVADPDRVGHGGSGDGHGHYR